MSTVKPVFPQAYGKYELLERIGEGGMAEVFRARLPGAAGFEKILVVKRILPHLARRADFVTMFVDEAKIAAKVQHQNVVQVFELGEAEGGELYMAMEYVSGVDYRRLLVNARDKKLGLPIWFALHVVTEVLNGLAYAHDLVDADGRPLQVVHRDVTPGNIFVSYQGEVKLADFGIAKAVGRVSETEAGQVKGNAPFMSPEAIYGKPLDARADVFSVGVVLWASLALRLPFEGASNYETARMVCEAPRQPPSRHNPRVPPELDKLAVWALEIQRERRVPSARELQRRLLEILSKLRPHRTSADVRHVVEILTGRRPPDEDFEASVGRAPQRSGGLDLHIGTPVWDAPETAHPAAEGLELAAPPPAGEGLPPDEDLDSSDSLTDLPDEPLDIRPPLEPSPAPPVAPILRATIPAGVIPAVPTAPLIFSGAERPAEERPRSAEARGPWQGEERTTPGPWGREASPGPWDSRSPTPRENVAVAPLYAPTAPLSAGPAMASSSTPDLILGDIPLASIMDFMAEGRAAEQPREAESFFAESHRFYVRTTDGHTVPAASLDELLAACDPRGRTAVAVSTDGSSWLEVAQFARLSGLDYLIPDDTALKKVKIVGMLEERSLVSVFHQIARHRLSGKLVIMDKGSTRVARREIDVFQGAPVAIFTDHLAYQVPRLAVQHHLLKKEIIADLVEAVIGRRVSIEQAAKERAFVDLASYRPVFMRDRLGEIFSWRLGRFAFDAGRDTRGQQSFAPSLLRLVLDGVAKGFTPEELRRELEPYMNIKQRRSESFDQVAAELGLKDKQKEVIKKLGQRTPLGQLLKRSPGETTALLVLSYVLVQLDLLITV